jgi:hypothetical protein
MNLNPTQTESFHPEMTKNCQHKPKDSPDTYKKTAGCWDFQG